MTESDRKLEVELAEIATSLRHLEEDMAEAKGERRAMADELKSFVARLVALEGQEQRMEGIPAQVAKNEKDNAVQEAVKRAYETFDERQAQRDRDLRQRVMMLLGIPGSLLSIAALVAIYQGVNGP